MVLPVTSDIYLTDVVDKTPLLGHLLSGLHVSPLPSEAGWGVSCADTWLKPQKVTQEHPGTVPLLPRLLPRLPDSPALPAQLGRCPGQVFTDSKHGADAAHKGPSHPKNRSHSCSVPQGPWSL